jgi:hypothetical protein
MKPKPESQSKIFLHSTALVKATFDFTQDRPFYKWKAKYSGMDASALKRLKELEAENQRLKEM